MSRFFFFLQIVFETNEEKALPKDKPRTFQLEISKISITNTRTNGGVSSRSNLAKVVNSCQMKNLFLNDRFPSKSTDYRVVTDKFIKHVQGWFRYEWWGEREEIIEMTHFFFVFR